MDLPTYTNIWRIEKRLYKLYDLRLPMPLPLGQIVAFVGITVPYVLLLTLIGVPFSHNLFWLYVLPPGVLTWLVTRPVLENKKLPELLVSQVRYLGEPKVWCRMAPATEKDEIVVVGQVWHASRQPAAAATAVEIRPQAPVPAYLPGQPAWAAAASALPGRGRRDAAPQSRCLGAAAGRARHRPGAGPRPARGGRIRPAASPGRGRAGSRGPHGGARIPGAAARRAAAQAQRHPVRPPASATQRGQQPAWATRARPGGPLGGPAETARRPRVIEVAHAEQGWPASPPAGPPLTPVPGVLRRTGPPQRTPRRRRSRDTGRRRRPGTRVHVPASGSRRTCRARIVCRAPMPSARGPLGRRAGPRHRQSQTSGTGTWPSVPAASASAASGPPASGSAASGPPPGTGAAIG